jgi:hypothetical protein
MPVKPPLIVPALRGSFGDWIYYSCVMELSEIGARVDYAREIHPDFNSLVLATYGGRLRSPRRPALAEEIRERAVGEGTRGLRDHRHHLQDAMT